MAATTAAVIGGVAAVGGAVSDRNNAKDAIKASADSNEAAQQFIAARAEEARGDILNLFPAAQEARQQGFQGALDVFAEGIPQQLSAFQQGNVGAQQALIGGLQPFQQAILGQPVDFSQFQPQTIGIDTGFLQQQLPQFTSSEQALAPDPALVAPEAAGPTPQDAIQQVLGGIFGRRPGRPSIAEGTGVTSVRTGRPTIQLGQGATSVRTGRPSIPLK